MTVNAGRKKRKTTYKFKSISEFRKMGHRIIDTGKTAIDI